MKLGQENKAKFTEMEAKYRSSLIQIRSMQDAAIKVKKIHDTEICFLKDSLHKETARRTQIETEMAKINAGLEKDVSQVTSAHKNMIAKTFHEKMIQSIMDGGLKTKLAQWRRQILTKKDHTR